MEIVPAILAKTREELEQAIRKIEPHTERVHLDILDGGFTPDKTILGYVELEQIKTNLKIDVHLMVMHPEEYIPQWLSKTIADRLAIHVESDDHLGDMFLEIRAQGKKAGIALNPETPTGAIIEYLSMVDYIQFMTVHPGSYGRPFLTDMIDKISTFHDTYPDKMIVVDGGMSPEVIPLVKMAGAQVIVSGSYIMNNPDPAKAIEDLKQAAIL